MVEVVELRKQFQVEKGQVRALDGLSFGVPDGTLLTLLGPSGCGKTTTLRCIAGLEQPDSGTITIGGRVVYSSEPRRFVPPEQRAMGMVFQSYAIWPHMTVFQNVAYPLQGQGHSSEEVRRRVHRVLELVGLAELAGRPAPGLSGGQQQRVALARALIAEPKVLLLDEPLSNLDAKLRQQMRTEIRQLQQQIGITAVYVTHDQEEALAVSDEVVFMHEGRIVERGRPEELYMRPRERLTAEFLGDANLLPAQVLERAPDSLVVQTPGGRIRSWARGNYAGGEEAVLFFRPESIRLQAQAPDDGYYLRGEVTQVLFLGKSVACGVKLGDQHTLRISLPPTGYPRVGDSVCLVVDPDLCSLFSR